MLSNIISFSPSILLPIRSLSLQHKVRSKRNYCADSCYCFLYLTLTQLHSQIKSATSGGWFGRTGCLLLSC